MPKKLSISFIIHTKNEQDHIIACIESCRSIADEILVVDMESTDETRERARKAGAKVVSVRDEGYVEPARQKAIEQAQLDWVFLLDADERITPSLSKYILQYLRHPSHEVVRLARKNIMFGKWMKHGMLWPDYQVRLFKKGSVVWPHEIHGQPTFQGDALDFPAVEKYSIVHYHSQSLHQRLQKIEQQAFSERYYASQKTIESRRVLERINGEFPRRFFEYEGYKDGVHGFINAKLMEYYRFLAFARYWELEGYADILSRDEMRSMWDTSEQFYKLLSENRKLRDSKFYQSYHFAKKILHSFKRFGRKSE